MNMIKNFDGEIFVGQWIYQSLYNKGLGVIYSIDENVNKGDIVKDVGYAVIAFNGGNVNVVFLNGSLSTHSESLLRKGVQYGLVDKALASQDTIAFLLE
ncbi:hypothetical protein ERJ77_27210, partial [Vibrio anguillarum]|nr:hypothetical protein [Vibrio anguillarum]